MTEHFFRSNLPVRRGAASSKVSDIQERRATDAKKLARCSSSEARALIPFEYAEEHRVLPLGRIKLNGRTILSVASESGTNPQLESALRFLSNHEVRLVAADGKSLERAIYLAYKGDDELLASKISAIRNLSPTLKYEEATHRKNDGVVPQFLATLIDYAVSRGASDIHISPRRDGTFVTLRVNGRLLSHDQPLCSCEMHSQLVSRLKVLAKLEISAQKSVHEGRFNFSVGTQEISVRLSIMPTIHGEKAVLRVHGMLELKELFELGLDAHTLNGIENVIHQPGGAVLFVGPTGCGKTTTMYSMMNRLRAKNLTLSSIEDPVELVMPGISQTSVDAKRGLNLAHSLKAVLRQDPDCIMLGEIRDSECARTVFEAAQTGHMVLSSIHGGSIGDLFLRLEDFGISRPTLAKALRLVVHQRLIPKLCEQCKVLDLAASNGFNRNIFKKVGCGECDYSGTCGRVLVSESLMIDEALEDVLLETGLVSLLRRISADSQFKATLTDKLYEGVISMSDFNVSCK